MVPKKSGTKNVRSHGKYSGLSAPRISILNETSPIPLGRFSKLVGSVVTPRGTPIIVTIRIERIMLPLILRASNIRTSKKPIPNIRAFAVPKSPKIRVFLSLAIIMPPDFKPISAM